LALSACSRAEYCFRVSLYRQAALGNEYGSSKKPLKIKGFFHVVIDSVDLVAVRLA